MSWRNSCLLGWALALACALPAIAADANDVARQSGNPSQAQREQVQPYNNAPVWRGVRSEKEHFTTTRSNVPETGVLIQSGGETWRLIRNRPVSLYGGIFLVLVPLVIFAFYRIKGPMTTHAPPSGRLIERFSNWDRLVHWSTAISFVILAVSGVIMLLGKHFLLPVLGYTLFSLLARVSIVLHNFVGPLFIVCAVLTFFTFLKDNWWKKHDILWLKKAGGLFTHEHIPSDRFNAGEKAWFWSGVFFLSIIVGTSGLVLNFPNFDQGRNLMQNAHLVHVIFALIYILAFFGHLYMGTLGVQGAYQSMRTGYVDESWAKEHHEYWAQKLKAAGSKGPAPHSAPARA